MKIEDVLKKLKKLKTLYEGAKKINSEGEAAAAAAAMQRLLVEYNLSMDEVENSINEEDSANRISEERVSGYNFKSIGGTWDYVLLFVICKHNFCKCFQLGSGYKNLVIMGSRENIDNVKWLKTLLAERFVEISNEKWKDYKKGLEYKSKPISKDRFQRHFLLGCASGLDVKLREIEERNKREDIVYDSKVTVLTIRSNDAIDEYVKNKYFSVKGRRARVDYVNSATSMGFYVGKNTDIYKSVNDANKEAVSNVNLLK